MTPGEFIIHKLTKERFVYLGQGEKDEAKLGTKVIVRDKNYLDHIFYEFEMEEEKVYVG